MCYIVQDSLCVSATPPRSLLGLDSFVDATQVYDAVTKCADLKLGQRGMAQQDTIACLTLSKHNTRDSMIFSPKTMGKPAVGQSSVCVHPAFLSASATAWAAVCICDA